MERKDDIPLLAEEEKIKLDIDFENVRIKKKRPFLLFIFLLLIVLTLICIFILRKAQIVKNGENEPTIDVSVNESSVWQGAFESEEVFNNCKESSVSIIAQGRRCSGFVYSTDGWIATVEGAVNENVKGQIEVILFDGRSFFVEGFRQNRGSGLILMKINASDLKTANIDERCEVHEGEELFTFCTVGGSMGDSSLFSGKVAHTKRNVNICRADGGMRSLYLMQIGILLTEEGVGAPFFDEKGVLVGIACSGGIEKERYMVDYAFSFSEVKSILDAMKDGERADYDGALNVIVEE